MNIFTYVNSEDRITNISSFDRRLIKIDKIQYVTGAAFRAFVCISIIYLSVRH